MRSAEGEERELKRRARPEESKKRLRRRSVERTRETHWNLRRAAIRNLREFFSSGFHLLPDCTRHTKILRHNQSAKEKEVRAGGSPGNCTIRRHSTLVEKLIYETFFLLKILRFFGRPPPALHFRASISTLTRLQEPDTSRGRSGVSVPCSYRPERASVWPKGQRNALHALK